MTDDYEGPPLTIGGGIEGEKAAHGGWTTWADMGAALEGAVPMPEVFTRSDGRASFYRGLVNAVIGESESGKSLLVQAACADVLKAGERVVWLDFEDNAIGVGHRLMALGVDRESIVARFHYQRPEGNFAAAEREALLEALELIGPTLVAVDGLTALMASQGLEVNSNTDAARVFAEVMNPLTDCGAAVVLIHHTTKSKESRGSYGLGGVMLKGLVRGSQLQVEMDAKRRHAPGRPGRSFLVIQKDGPGGLEPFTASGRRWGTFVTTSERTGETDAFGHDTFRTEYRLEYPFENLAHGPTACMEKVSIFLEGEGEPVAKATVEKATECDPFGRDTRRKALDALEAAGFITRDDTAKGKAAGYVVVKAYREPTEQETWAQENDTGDPFGA